MDGDTFPLSPVDYVFTGAGSQPITFAFQYGQSLDESSLRKGLEQVLLSFPLLRSRLVRSGENALAYRIAEDGLIFEVVESDRPFHADKDITRYVTPVQSTVGNPLAKIALTRAKDGSVLGVSISHALVDGFSYFHFLSSWARACRGEKFLPPDVNREGIFPLSEKGGEPVTAENLLEHCGLFLAEKRDPHPALPSSVERMTISKDELRARMDEAKKDCPGAILSENDVITAWLWKNILPRWIQAAGRPETYVTCPVDCRRILKTIPRNYFGCALCFTSAAADFDTLGHASTGELAHLVHEAVRRVNHDFVSKSMDTLERFRRSEGIGAMERLHLRDPSAGLIVTNLTRMPLKDINFGSGSPAGFLIHADVSAGAALLPAEDGIEAVILNPPRQP